MNLVEHTRYIWELQDFIAPAEIDYLLGSLEFNSLELQKNFRNNARQNDTYSLDENKDLDEIAWNWINNANRYYIENNRWIFYQWNKYGMIYEDEHQIHDVSSWDGKNILRVYNHNDTYHWHGDQSPYNHAEFSYIVYLNDDFEGGRTLFLNDRLGVSPKKGSVLCFPVDHYHIHKGTRVTSGVKKIVWNCLYRKEIQMSVNYPYATVINAPRSSKKCIW